MGRLILVLALCVVAGCGRGTPTQPAASGLPPIDSRLELQVRERLLPAGRTLELYARTERDFMRYPVWIAYEIGGADPIAIRFVGYSLPPDHGHDFSPATCTIPLGPTTEGAWSLTLSVNGEVAPALLQVTADSLRVTGGEGRWTTFPEPVMMRVPPGTIWGLITWDRGDQSARAQAFLDSLANRGAIDIHPPAGDYFYFTVDTQGHIVTPGLLWPTIGGAFVFAYPDGVAPLAPAARSVGDSLHISMWDDRGGVCYSWLAPNGTDPACLIAPRAARATQRTDHPRWEVVGVAK